MVMCSNGLGFYFTARAIPVAQRCSTTLRQVAKDADVDEFIFTMDITVNALGKLQQSKQPTYALQQKLLQFNATLDAFERLFQTSSTTKLVEKLSSARRRPIFAQEAIRVQTELRLALDASGAAIGSSSDLATDEALKQRLTDSFSSADVRKLWETLFQGENVTAVEWDTFLEAYEKATGSKLTSDDDNLLKHVLDNDSLGGVTARSFNHFLKIFGPLNSSLANIRSLFKQKWFHGFLTVEEVVRLLSDQTPGTFLVRFSRSKPDSFVLEYVESKGKIRTTMIKNDMPRGVRIMEEATVEKVYPSIADLIAHYSTIMKCPFVSDFLSQPWFFGDISTDEAIEMLSTRPIGTFMVRFSDSGRFSYVLSFVTKDESPSAAPGSYVVKHLDIWKVPSGYTLGAEQVAQSDTPSSTSMAVNRRIEDEKGHIVYPSLSKLIHEWKSVLRFNFSTHRVPSLRLVDYGEALAPVDLVGPGNIVGTGLRVGHGPGFSHVCAQNSVTYPKDSYPWQIVCDQFAVRVLGSRTVFALADGCGWGARSRLAAVKASQCIIDRLGSRAMQTTLVDTNDIRRMLLRSFSYAHDAIVENEEAPGTTTLVAGMIVEYENPANPHDFEYGVVFASVGDCKAYIWSAKEQRVIDPTSGNRSNLRDAKDPGGRLGPWVNDGPDLRNLATFFWPLSPGDVVFAVTDGIHDNVEPECCGITPAATALKLKSNPLVPASVIKAGENAGDSWDKVSDTDMEPLKVFFQTDKIKQLLTQTAGGNQIDSFAVATACVNNALQMTNNSRTFMEQNPTKPEPSDHVEYPGKMDHATIVALQATPYFPKSQLKFYKPTETTGSASLGSVLAAAAGTAQMDVPPTSSSSSSSSSVPPKGSSQSSLSSDSGKLDSFKTMSANAGPCERLSDKLLLNAPSVAVADYISNEYVKLLTGPSSAAEGEMKLGSMASGWSTSTFPVIKQPDGTRSRIGDPNNSFYSVELTPTRITLAISSSSNWNTAAAQGSAAANRTFLDAISRFQPHMKSIVEAKIGCLRAFDMAHQQLLAMGSDGKVTAGLLAALLLRSKDNSRKWTMLVTTIGSSKVFLWRKADGVVRDITRGSAPADRSDNGGRLGDYTAAGAPDLRNLTMYSSEVDEGDIVFALSPSAQNNFEPDVLGDDPQDLDDLTDDDKATWASLLQSNPQRLCDAKDAYRCTQLGDMFSEHSAELTPSSVTKSVVQHCQEKTKKTRSFMESNPYSKEPSDHKTYPGKLGHIACLSVRVGTVPKSELQTNSLLPTMFEPLLKSSK
jgi:serine/threonine protein phosphatase PrpC